MGFFETHKECARSRKHVLKIMGYRLDILLRQQRLDYSGAFTAHGCLTAALPIPQSGDETKTRVELLSEVARRSNPCMQQNAEEITSSDVIMRNQVSAANNRKRSSKIMGFFETLFCDSSKTHPCCEMPNN